MKLYAFDSCPYCTRVRALIGLKDIDCKIEYFALGELPTDIVDKLENFTVPILEYPVEDINEKAVMTESFNIFKKLDQLTEAYFKEYEVSGEIEQHLLALRQPQALLCYPRMPFLNLPELATESAMVAFTTSREAYLGKTLQQALIDTEDHLSEIKAPLLALDAELETEALLNGERKLTINDIVVFAELRNLTMVEDLQLPAGLLAYLNYISGVTTVTLYPSISKNCQV
ncbi:glutathione S-transferase N-terminal domain-containing protein [Photobacterium kasasachensis]|uniref:glutathione S-transferase N-terminal domain-containing protein n=1 Tax=Photobacterium kasasachensis TaxID=2910240 RepID=UPI003D0B19E4